MYEKAELLAKLFLDIRRDLLVRCGIETAARDFRGEPICLGESNGQGNEVFLDLLGRKLVANLVEGIDSLEERQVKFG